MKEISAKESKLAILCKDGQQAIGIFIKKY